MIKRLAIITLLVATLVILVGCEPKEKLQEIPWTPINPPVEVTPEPEPEPEPEPIEKPERIEQELFGNFTEHNVSFTGNVQFAEHIANGYTKLRLEVAGTGSYVNYVTFSNIAIDGSELQFRDVPGIAMGSSDDPTTGVINVPYADNMIEMNVQNIMTSSSLNFRIGASTEIGFIEFDLAGLTDMDIIARVTTANMLGYLKSFKIILT